ncbi:SH3 domain-containing kinase-binding protein 1 [Hondaea fermentalgiana]|uniref:SH3 domain-containing kinase-binding protein 1 n=1 Tax=Hondaea fermentalgiana TaxID=2315210 RepID=A0A2R5GHM8_9STRA|nr:SH3 domain-containing kinase-binding protein 1 [Hondaea fermentalgiana]|eukprot:GBG28153.1 SH3 domain-containing kinase-binding protein 1 [Hondaea fermentalgiana]
MREVAKAQAGAGGLAPLLAGPTATLLEELKNESAGQLSKLMSISDALGKLNYERYQGWEEATTYIAADLFDGEAFKALDVDSFSAEDRAQMQSSLVILSGLYGMIRPGDAIRPYRLEMGTKYAVDGTKNLVAFWKKHGLTDTLAAHAKSVGAKIILNCASDEYAKAVDFAKLEKDHGLQVLRFKGVKPGGARGLPGVFSKQARGMMSRFVIQSKAQTAQDLEAFTGSDNRFAFLRRDGNEMIFERYDAPRTARGDTASTSASSKTKGKASAAKMEGSKSGSAKAISEHKEDDSAGDVSEAPKTKTKRKGNSKSSVKVEDTKAFRPRGNPTSEIVCDLFPAACLSAVADIVVIIVAVVVPASALTPQAAASNGTSSSPSLNATARSVSGPLPIIFPDAALGQSALSLGKGKASAKDGDGPKNVGYDDLWDGLDVCLEQASGTKLSTKDLATGLGQWSAAERDYINKLPFTRKRYELPSCEAGSLGTVLEAFCSSFVKIGEARSRLSSVVGAMGTQLHQFRREQNQAKRKLELDGAKLRKALQLQEQAFQRAKLKYEKACRDAEQLIALKEKAHQEKALQEVSKLWQRTTDALIVVQESEQQYRLAVEELRDFRTSYATAMQRVLRELQVLEENRIEYIKALTHGIVDSYTELSNQFAQVIDEIAEAAEAVDCHKDIDGFVKRNLRPQPEPVAFESSVTAKIEAEIEILVGGGVRPGTAHGGDGLHATSLRRYASASSAATPTSIPTRPIPTRPSVSSRAIATNKNDESDCSSDENPSTGNEQYIVKNSGSVNFVRVLYEYEAEEDSELTVQPGDIVQVVEKDGSGWWEGRLANGKTGSFPENYTQAATAEEAAKQGFVLARGGASREASSAEEPPSRPRRPRGASENDEPDGSGAESEDGDTKQVVVIFDYEAQDPCDLTIRRREVLTVHGVDEDGGWLDASDKTGNRGMIPANYVRALARPGSALSA